MLPSINLVPLQPTKKVLKPFFLLNFPLIISFETNSEMQTKQRHLSSGAEGTCIIDKCVGLVCPMTIIPWFNRTPRSIFKARDGPSTSQYAILECTFLDSWLVLYILIFYKKMFILNIIFYKILPKSKNQTNMIVTLMMHKVIWVLSFVLLCSETDLFLHPYQTREMIAVYQKHVFELQTKLILNAYHSSWEVGEQHTKSQQQLCDKAIFSSFPL